MLQPVWQQYKGKHLWYTRAMRAKCLWLPPPPGSQGKQSSGQTQFHCPRASEPWGAAVGKRIKESESPASALFSTSLFINHSPFCVLHKLLFCDDSIHCSAACLQSWGLGDGDRCRSLIPWSTGWNSSASIMAAKKLREREGPGARCNLKGIAPSDVPCPSRYRGWEYSFVRYLLLFTRCYTIKPNHQNKSKKGHIHFIYLVLLCMCSVEREQGKCILFPLNNSGIVFNLTGYHTTLLIISYQFHPARRQNK